MAVFLWLTLIYVNISYLQCKLITTAPVQEFTFMYVSNHCDHFSLDARFLFYYTSQQSIDTLTVWTLFTLGSSHQDHSAVPLSSPHHLVYETVWLLEIPWNQISNLWFIWYLRQIFIQLFSKFIWSNFLDISQGFWKTIKEHWPQDLETTFRFHSFFGLQSMDLTNSPFSFTFRC